MKKKLLFLTIISLFITTAACGQKKTPANTTKTNVETKSNTETKPIAVSKLFGANLLKNSGAETGNGSSWTTDDELKTFRYDGGWGDAWEVMPPNKGEYYFYVKMTSEKPTLPFSQEFDVSEIAKDIDANQVGYNLSLWVGIRGTSGGRLKAEFYDANKALIGRPKEDMDASEKITLANKPNDVTMTEKTRGGDVPTGTRKIKVTLEFSFFEDANKVNEGEAALADNLSFVLTNKK